MLSFEHPALLWGLLGLLPLLLLHLLRRRFRRRPSGSIWIWRRLASSASGARKPGLRALLLLALQTGAFTLAILGAAGPALLRPASLEGGLGILIDVSGSMGTRDLPVAGGKMESRLEAAKARAAEILRSLPPGRPAALFACAGSLEVLAGPERARGPLLAALGRLAAGDGSFREARVAEDLRAWLSLRPESWDFLLLSDGGLELGGRSLAALLGQGLSFEGIGGGEGGLGLGSLHLEAEGKTSLASFRVWNGSGETKELRVELGREGKALWQGPVSAPPGWSEAARTLPVNKLEGLWELGWKAGASEGLYRLLYEAPPPRRLLLLGPRDPWLLAALEGEGTIVEGLPALPSAPLPPYDLVVAEALQAPDGLGSPLLSLGAIPEGAPLEAGPLAAGDLSFVGSGPLLRFVGGAGSRVSRSLSFLPGPGVRILARAGGRIVGASWEKGGYPRLALGFLPGDSTLVLSADWPLLLRNLLEEAAPRSGPETAYTLVAGDLARRPLPEGFALAGAGAPKVHPGRPLSSLEPGSAGLFAWRAGKLAGRLAVNPPVEELDRRRRSLAAAGLADKGALPAPPPQPGQEGGAAPTAKAGTSGAALPRAASPLPPPTASALPAPAASALPATRAPLPGREARLPLGTPLLLGALLCLGAEWILWWGLPRLGRRRKEGSRA